MSLYPSIVFLECSHYLGLKMDMSVSNDQTFRLWSSLMPQIKNIKNRIGSDLYSFINYPDNYFSEFQPQLKFEKWAAVKVEKDQISVNQLECFALAGGKYAKFQHKGSSELFLQTMSEIYREWLSNSGFTLDNRLHFTVMDKNYRPDMEVFEEEIWVPVV